MKSVQSVNLTTIHVTVKLAYKPWLSQHHCYVYSMFYVGHKWLSKYQAIDTRWCCHAGAVAALAPLG